MTKQQQKQTKKPKNQKNFRVFFFFEDEFLQVSPKAK